MRCLVIGCGSIGHRHITNLLKLGVEVYVYDRNLELLEKELNEFNIKTFDFRSEHIRMDAWIVAVPPNYHTIFIKECLEHGYHCFVEKPISNSIDGLEELVNEYEKAKLTLMVGYQLRYNTGLQEIKRVIESCELGKLLSVRAVYGNNLKNWHPDEDYHKLYTGHKLEGGGCVLDCSHEIDYLQYIIGENVSDVKAILNKVADLEIDVEDTADILLYFGKKNVTVNVHLDIVDKEYKRECHLVFENGNIDWTPGRYTINNIVNWNNQSNTTDYLSEMKDFIQCVCGGNQTPLSDGRSAIETLKVCLRILK